MPRRWYFRVAPCQSIIFHWPPSSFPEPTTPQGNICQLSHQEFVQFVPELAISSNISSPIWAFLFIKKLIVNKISLKILPWKPGAPYVGKKAVTFCRLLALKLSRKIIAKVPGNDQWHAVWRETLAPFWNSLKSVKALCSFLPPFNLVMAGVVLCNSIAFIINGIQACLASQETQFNSILTE